MGMTLKKFNSRLKLPQILWGGAFLLIVLAGCRPALRLPPVTATPQTYRPAPPVVATATPAVEPAALSQALSTPVCMDNLIFLADATIPDGSEVEPNSTMDKRWEVKNSGNCNWDERYRLRLIAGPAMGAAQEQALYPARSGAQVTIRIVFQAPAEAGSYRSAWQAYNPEGQPFGDPIFIDIKVK